MHVRREPAILYFGTPVVLISTLNEDGSANLAPMSSAFWLGWRCMLGLNRSSKTAQNLLRERECVLNLPSEREVDHVDALALTTGVNPVPTFKLERGYTHVRAKFSRARLTAVDSHSVRPPRAAQCPIQLEATLERAHGFGDSDPALSGRLLTFEVKIEHVHIDESILLEGHRNRIDPDKWRPLIMSFQQFYGLTSQRLRTSRLATIAEEKYRTPVQRSARANSGDLKARAHDSQV